jgi:hypothetical protein
MATDYTTINNIVNLNKGIQLTNEAVNLIKNIKEKVVFVFEDYIIEDLDKFRTCHMWELYIITLNNEGREIPHYFFREINITRNKEHKIINKSNMPEFKEHEITEYHLDFISNIKNSGSIE